MNRPTLSKAGQAAASVERCNTVLASYVAILYESDLDGYWPNIDNRTGRLLLPAPFGSAGYKLWGLTHREALVLRSILRGRVEKPRHVALFDFNDLANTWHLDVLSYPSIDKAKSYLAHCAVTLAEWRDHGERYSTNRVTVQARYRKRQRSSK
jgi:hypothetical protein